MHGARKFIRLAPILVAISAITSWLWYERADNDQLAQQSDASDGGLRKEESSPQELASGSRGPHLPIDPKSDSLADQKHPAPATVEHGRVSPDAMAREHRGIVTHDAMVLPLTSATLQRWHDTINADCHGQGIAECKSLMQTFSRTLQADEDIEDGWSEWMETQIINSLREQASANQFTQIGAKCDAAGCVFFVASRSAAEMFGGPKHHDDFNRWLGAQPWNGELEVNTKLNGDNSTLAWEVYGLSTQPYHVWYVVTKKELEPISKSKNG